MVDSLLASYLREHSEQRPDCVITVANYNADNQVVISGDPEVLPRLVKSSSFQGLNGVTLSVGGLFTLLNALCGRRVYTSA